MSKNSSSRDDFTKPTIRLLRERAGELCSKPDCRVATRGASSQKDKTASIGVAAHITGAAPGAARYDPELTSAQRKHYDNGIWLCHTCSRLIDVDESRFPVSLLQNWKTTAENQSASNIGKQLITKEDSDKHVTEQVLKHITGNGDALFRGLPKVIEHYDSKLAALDPRFNISTEVSDGNVRRTIQANEEVSLSLLFEGKALKQFGEQYEALEKYGKDINIPFENVTASGSRLFEEITKNTEEQGILTLNAEVRHVDLDIFVCHEQERVLLTSCKGEFRAGTDRVTIEATALKGFLSFQFIDNKGEEFNRSRYHFDAAKWVGLDIQKIPYFPRLQKVLPLLKRGGRLLTEITDEHGIYEIGDSKYQDDPSWFHKIISLISYFDMARQIAKSLQKLFVFDDISTLNQKSFDSTRDLFYLLKGPVMYNAKDGKLRLKQCITFQHEEEKSFPIPFVVFKIQNFKLNDYSYKFYVMGYEVTVPSVELVMSEVKVELLSGPKFNGKDFDMEIAYVLSDDGKCVRRLVSSSSVN